MINCKILSVILVHERRPTTKSNRLVLLSIYLFMIVIKGDSDDVYIERYWLNILTIQSHVWLS